MPAPLPNIMLVLSISSEPQLRALGTLGYSGRVCLAGESWATNLVSLLSSSVPSHHRVWAAQGKMGIHVDPLPAPLKKAGYRTAFVGPRDAGDLATQCGFEELVLYQDGDGAGEATPLLERPGATPAFITCVVPEFSEQWQDLGSRFDIVLLSRLVSLAPPAGAGATRLDARSSPFTLHLHENEKNVDGSSHLWSIIDLAPSLLGLLGIKAPYTMVGKDMHLYWLGKPRKAIPFPRARCIYEHPDGSKTLWNGRYLLAVHPGSEAGEMFDLGLRDGAAINLWDDPSATDVKNSLLLELLWAQLDKECMPMPRIAGA